MQPERLSSSETRVRYGMPEARCMAPKTPAPAIARRNASDEEVNGEERERLRAAAHPELATLQLELDAAPARPSLLEAALVLQLMEALAEPVFVLCARGSLLQANLLGRTWLRTHEGCEAVLALRAAVAADAAADGFSVTRVHDSAQTEVCWLARSTRGASALAKIVVERARHRWGLRERSVPVLEQVACGRSNKEIAAALGRSEVTVERHLTQLFRVTGCQSRAELIAKLYAL